jgi:hypothetical protein
MRILTLPFPFLLHLITHKALWMSLLLLCLSLTCFLLFITIPTPHCRRFICYWDYCKWCLGLQYFFFQFVFHTASSDLFNWKYYQSILLLKILQQVPITKTKPPNFLAPHAWLYYLTADCCSLKIFYSTPIILYTFRFECDDLKHIFTKVCLSSARSF